MSKITPDFDLNCRACPRLASFLDDVGKEYPDYHARPVPQFGVKSPKLLIVGLAPEMHGSNASGRPFTGDHAGILLFETLYKFKYSNRPKSVSAYDKLTLKHCRITNAVKCLPPENKPTGEEIITCNVYLKNEINALKKGTVIMALGSIAHKAVLLALDLKQSAYPFSHGAEYHLDNGLILVSSYHCSRYNTSTRRLTPSMFENVFKQVDILLER
jgi:uracil-DNA glycosylase family 4